MINLNDLFSHQFPDDTDIANTIARNVSSRDEENWKEAVVLSLYDDIRKLKQHLRELTLAQEVSMASDVNAVTDLLIFPTQDPKYGIQESRLVNMTTGKPIPHDEPVFIFRGQDRKLLAALTAYMNQCEDEAHINAIEQRIVAIEEWQSRNVDKLKEPDSSY